MHNTEINERPFRLHYGDYNKLAEKYTSPINIDKPTRNRYINDLHELQKIANDASKIYQQQLHDKRVRQEAPSSTQ